MSIVKMGRKWEINTKEDYDKAMEILDGNEFCAEMSDDFFRSNKEKAEVARQRAEVIAQARAKGII
jgi:hypothetical protein